MARLHIPAEAPTAVATTLLLISFPAARAEAAHTGVGVGTEAGIVGMAKGVTGGAVTTALGTAAVVMGRWRCRTDVAGESPVLLAETGGNRDSRW